MALRDFMCGKLSEALHKEWTIENLKVILLPLKHQQRQISGIEDCAVESINTRCELRGLEPQCAL